MAVPEDPIVLHPEADEGIDVEEPAIVQFLDRRLPEGEAVILPLQEGIDGGGVGVDFGENRIDGHADLGLLARRAAPARRGGLPCRGGGGSRFGVDEGRDRQVAERVAQERQFVGVRPAGRPRSAGR